MKRIKVTVKSVEKANEIIEYWKDKEVDLTIEVKENTTTLNSDVNPGNLKVRGKFVERKSVV